MTIAPLILSASSIRSYLTCRKRYYYESVLRMPAASSMQAVIGIAVHAGAEAFVKPSPLRPVDVLQASFDREVARVPADSEISPETGISDARKLLKMWQAHIQPTLGRTTLAEASFTITVDGQLVTGQIDFADDDVHDTKTTATLSDFRPDSYRLQLSIYRHGFRALLGRWPKRLILDVLARNGRWKQIEMQHDDHELGVSVAVAATGILEGRFDPTGAATGACKWCPFLRSCPDARVD